MYKRINEYSTWAESLGRHATHEELEERISRIDHELANLDARGKCTSVLATLGAHNVAIVIELVTLAAEHIGTTETSSYEVISATVNGRGGRIRRTFGLGSGSAVVSESSNDKEPSREEL